MGYIEPYMSDTATKMKEIHGCSIILHMSEQVVEQTVEFADDLRYHDTHVTSL